MTYERVTVVLNEDEMAKLRRIAQSELRRPRDQAAYILRLFLREGLPPSIHQPTTGPDAMQHNIGGCAKESTAA
jgi:hypothetical protein